MSQASMLAAFASYERNTREHSDSAEHNIMQQYPGTRLYRIVRIPGAWRVWLATRDYIHGSFLELHDTGLVIRYECRPDEGEESIIVRPSDDDIRRVQRGSGSAATTNTATNRGDDIPDVHMS